MDIDALQAFEAVARKQSFSRAAEELFLTQPAVSKRVALLEEELGSRLFDRTGRRVLLTEAGRELERRARRILQELQDTRRAIRNLSGQVGGSLALATSHHIGLHHLAPVLRTFTSEYPVVRLDIRFTDSEIAHDAVLRGDLELAVITLPPEPDPRVEAVTIWPDPLVFVCGRDHPLARRRKPALTDLVGYDALLPSSNTFTRRIAGELFAAEQLALNVAIETNYLETIKVMTAVGLGWSILPESMLDASLRRVPVPGVRISRRLGYVVHKERTLSNAGNALISILRTHAVGT